MAAPAVPSPAADSAPSGERRPALVEALLALALLVAPWAYGGAPDSARYALAAWLGAALALGSSAADAATRTAAAFARRAWPLPVLGLLQVATGRSAMPWATLESALLLALWLGCAAWWSGRAHSAPGAARRLVAVVLLSATAQAVFGGLQHGLSPGRLYGEATAAVTMPFGSYVNHNHFAGFVGLASILAVAWGWGLSRRAGTLTPAGVALFGLALGLAVTVLASRSRGGLLALGVGLAVLAAGRLLEPRAGDSRPRIGRAVAASLGVTLAALALALALAPPASRTHLAALLRGAPTADPSIGYRLDVARDTLLLAADRPLLGWGLGAFADAFPARKRGHGAVRSEHAESDVLEFAAEGGLLGLAAVAWLAAFVLPRARERSARGRDPQRRLLAGGVLASLAALGVHSLIDFNLRLPANALVASALVGLAAAGRPGRKDERVELENEAAAAPAWRRALAPAALLLAALSAWRAWGAWQFDRALTAPAPQRIGRLDRVLARHPYLAAAWRARAQAWRDEARAGTPLAGWRLQRAGRDFERALRLRPRWAEVRAEHGWLLFVTGDAAGARRELDRARDDDPGHTGVGLTRAQLLARTGALDDALLQLGQTLSANPDWGSVAALRVALDWTRDPQRLQALIRNDSQAQRLLEEALSGSPRERTPP